MNSEINIGLIAHLPFTQNCEDRTGSGYVVESHNIEHTTDGPGGELMAAAAFNGLNSGIKIERHPRLNFGRDAFSIAVWVKTNRLTDVVGDIVSKFDLDARRGFNLGIITNTGVTTTTQPNYRNIHFGIDNAKLSDRWTDCGRPGRAVQILSLAAIRGNLYAGTTELEAGETGHLWRYAEDGEWTDLGAAPEGCNSVTSIAEYEGALHCCTGRYNPVGSRLGPPKNERPGGRVYRVEPDGTWIECGHPGSQDAVPEETPTMGYETGKADEAMSLTVYRGELYVTSNHRRGAFKYESDGHWKRIGPNERIMSFTVYRDRLYALINGGPVYRYEGGDQWTYCGTPARSTQTYGAVTYQDNLYVGTWPECEVLRYGGGEAWVNVGRVGYEREVMALALYNGKVYLGTLPMGNVWRMDQEDFTFVGNLDNTPTVFLRRVWSMAVYQGKLFGGTLPSGHVLSIEAGRMATHDHSLEAGWRHIAAVRDESCLKLYLDGRPVATSSTYSSNDYDLSNDAPLKIGFGNSHRFHGSMCDLRTYGRAISPHEILQLSDQAHA
ncbi:MAG: hypothetical protein AUJ92_08680 [Armatimonadetes bacterium CG2_30_59_28]|nr:LamG domain-containing protein [Armatimonadota bacterium]OIO95019.1 MAG: hypothetical protein AUJ92_08680 [Armatimonadetes bacterium CG2_30_59_28]